MDAGIRTSYYKFFAIKEIREPNDMTNMYTSESFEEQRSKDEEEEEEKATEQVI